MGRSAVPFEKRMHVSPFQPMEQTYEISLGEPRDELRVAIRNLEEGREVFTATHGAAPPRADPGADDAACCCATRR